jgi:hypothetical protein
MPISVRRIKEQIKHCPDICTVLANLQLVQLIPKLLGASPSGQMPFYQLCRACKRPKIRTPGSLLTPAMVVLYGLPE